MKMILLRSLKTWESKPSKKYKVPFKEKGVIDFEK